MSDSPADEMDDLHTVSGRERALRVGVPRHHLLVHLDRDPGWREVELGEQISHGLTLTHAPELAVHGDLHATSSGVAALGRGGTLHETVAASPNLYNLGPVR